PQLVNDPVKAVIIVGGPIYFSEYVEALRIHFSSGTPKPNQLLFRLSVAPVAMQRVRQCNLYRGPVRRTRNCQQLPVSIGRIGVTPSFHQKIGARLALHFTCWG